MKLSNYLLSLLPQRKTHPQPLPGGEFPRTSHFALRTILTLLFFTLTNISLAQYTGGEGDGYARASTSKTITSLQESELSTPAIVLLPNIVQTGERIKVKINDSQALTSKWKIYSLQGNVIQNNVILKEEENYLETTIFSSGMYYLAPTEGNKYEPIIFTILD